MTSRGIKTQVLPASVLAGFWEIPVNEYIYKKRLEKPPLKKYFLICKIIRCSHQKMLKLNTYKFAIHGGCLKSPSWALQETQLCFSLFSNAATLLFFLHYFRGSGIGNKCASYLLVKESPEHGQRDVEEQHSEDHLDLCNQEFLVPTRGKRRCFIYSMTSLVLTCFHLHMHTALTSYFSSAQSIQWALLG